MAKRPESEPLLSQDKSEEISEGAGSDVGKFLKNCQFKRSRAHEQWRKMKSTKGRTLSAL